jgi:hypothetical protein
MILLVAAWALCAAPAVAAEAPGAPGAVANWTAGDKDGFGTARPLASNVWFTLAGGELSEVYAPDLGTPSFRDLQFVVSDGTPTFSATPLGWTHAQLVRLAWSLDAGHPVERPAVVARRYP